MGSQNPNILAQAQRLDRLRKLRPSPTRPAAVGDLSKDILAAARKTSTKAGRCFEALSTLLGPRLIESVTVTQVRGDTLTLSAVHPSARFTAERLMYLKGCLRQELVSAGISRVRWKAS